MYRYRDASATLREAIPPVLTDVFAVVTELGGLAFILVALSVLYWVGDRENTATVIAYALVALAVTLFLKEWFALPRPPASVRAIGEAPETSGFPSGHAVSATVVYGGLVLAYDRVRDLRVAGPALLVVVLVGLSRIVIGVHYLGDVLAGFAVGTLVLGGLWLTVGRRPDILCLLAAVVAAPAVLLTAGGSYALLGVGAGLGGAVAFYTTDLGSLPEPTAVVQTVVFVPAGLALAGVLFWLAEAVATGLAVSVVGAILVAGIVLLPKALTTRPLAALAD